MATGMIGANPEELRALAGIFGQKAEAARTGRSVTVPEVEGVEWEGPDADAFRERYRSEVAPKLDDLAERLEEAKSELERQAQEQDTCSQGKSFGIGGSIQAGSDDPGLLGAIKMLYKDWNFFRKPGQFARFLMEGAALARNPWLAAPWFMEKGGWHRWASLTGLVEGTGGLKIPSALTIEGQAAKMFGPFYNAAKGYTDFLGGNNWLSKPLEGKLPEGLRNRVVDFVGKEGRMAARGLGALGVAFDGYETFDAIRNGNWTGNGDITKGALWNGAQAALGVACFVPGPVGWVATGVSAGMAVYENWDTISNGAKAVWDKGTDVIGDAAGALADHGGKILSGLNPFD